MLFTENFIVVVSKSDASCLVLWNDEALYNCLLLSAGAARACAQREVSNPFLHVHRLRESPQTLPSAQPGQAWYSRGEGGRRKCKYTSHFLTHSTPPQARGHHQEMSSVHHISNSPCPPISIPSSCAII